MAETSISSGSNVEIDGVAHGSLERSSFVIRGKTASRIGQVDHGILQTLHYGLVLPHARQFPLPPTELFEVGFLFEAAGLRNERNR
jgi:hypothetical protein